PSIELSRRARVANGDTKARKFSSDWIRFFPFLDFVFSCFRVLGCDGYHLSLSCIQIVPIHDRVESEAERALRLPSPERANREHDDVAVANLLVDRSGAAGDGLTTGQRTGEQ